MGGIVGTGVDGTIENCKVEANITSSKSSADSGGSYSYASGIVGIAIAEFSTDVNKIYVKNCVIGPDSGTMSITTDGYAGGICARITTGITEFNITDTTIQNVTITTNLTTSDVGAVCGGLYVENGLTGNVSVKNVNVVNHYSSNTETSGGVKFLYYTTDSSYESSGVYASKIIAKSYSGKTLSSIGVSEYTIIVGTYQWGGNVLSNGTEYEALTMTAYAKYNAGN